MHIDHIAFLVRSIEAASKRFFHSCTLHEIEEQPAEGTLERYMTFGEGNFPSVLLMQAIADGPYMRAMKKRGPGVHHLGCVCSNIEDVVLSDNRGSLFLHPISIRTIPHGTVWLCRPGLPFLIELNQRPIQTNMPGEKARLMLPERFPVPPYAGREFENVIVENTGEKLFHIQIHGIGVTLDPDVV